MLHTAEHCMILKKSDPFRPQCNLLVFLSILLYFWTMVKKTCVTYSRTIWTRILKDFIRQQTYKEDFIRQQTYKSESHENITSIKKKNGTSLCAALGTASTQHGLEMHPYMTDLTMWAMWCHDNTYRRLSTGSMWCHDNTHRRLSTGSMLKGEIIKGFPLTYLHTFQKP